MGVAYGKPYAMSRSRSRRPQRRDAASGGRELPQHISQDAAVAVVIDLVRRIEPDGGRERRLLALRVRRRDRELLLRREVLRDARDGESLLARQPEALCVLPGLVLEREDAHPREVRAVDALEALRNHRRMPRSIVPFAAQSREDPVPYSAPAR